MRMLGKDLLVEAIDLAVSRALQSRLPAARPAMVDAVKTLVREEFQQLIKDKGRTVRGVKRSQFLLEIEEARGDIVRRRDAANSELDELQKQIGMLKGLRLADAEGSLPGKAEMADELCESFSSILSELEPGVRREALRTRLAEAAAETARAQWDRVLDDRASAADDEVQVFRRRIEKLNRSLERTETALEEMSKLKEGDPGIASLYKSVQGIDDGAYFAAQKRAMMRALFEDNASLQRAGSPRPSGRQQSAG